MKNAVAAAASRRPVPRGTTAGEYIKSVFMKLAEIEATEGSDEAVVTNSRRRTYPRNTKPKSTFGCDSPRIPATLPPTLASSSSTVPIRSSTSLMASTPAPTAAADAGCDDDDEDDEDPGEARLLQPCVPVPANPFGPRESSNRRTRVKSPIGILKTCSSCKCCPAEDDVGDIKSWGRSS